MACCWRGLPSAARSRAKIVDLGGGIAERGSAGFAFGQGRDLRLHELGGFIHGKLAGQAAQRLFQFAALALLLLQRLAMGFEVALRFVVLDAHGGQQRFVAREQLGAVLGVEGLFADGAGRGVDSEASASVLALELIGARFVAGHGFAALVDVDAQDLHAFVDLAARRFELGGASGFGLGLLQASAQRLDLLLLTLRLRCVRIVQAGALLAGFGEGAFELSLTRRIVRQRLDLCFSCLYFAKLLLDARLLGLLHGERLVDLAPLLVQPRALALLAFKLLLLALGGEVGVAARLRFGDDGLGALRFAKLLFGRAVAARR